MQNQQGVDLLFGIGQDSNPAAPNKSDLVIRAHCTSAIATLFTPLQAK
jgi:hypothetical protein